jgi:hypothetical protein
MQQGAKDGGKSMNLSTRDEKNPHRIICNPFLDSFCRVHAFMLVLVA